MWKIYLIAITKGLFALTTVISKLFEIVTLFICTRFSVSYYMPKTVCFEKRLQSRHIHQHVCFKTGDRIYTNIFILQIIY